MTAATCPVAPLKPCFTETVGFTHVGDGFGVGLSVMMETSARREVIAEPFDFGTLAPLVTNFAVMPMERRYRSTAFARAVESERSFRVFEVR